MRRREFITLAGGAAVAWPVAASAQQERVRRIGIMLSGAENDPEMQARVNALRQGLQALGWIEGRNYHFEYRWPESDAERVKTDTAQLIALAPDVIVAGSQLGVMALLQETRSIPIVFVNLADPVGSGIVGSLASSGRNITGFTAFEFATAGKWLELLKEIAPRITRVAVVFAGPGGRTGEAFYRALETLAPSFPVELTPLRLNDPADVESIIAAFASKPDGGLVAAAETGAVINRAAIIRAAARHRLPA